MNAFAGMLRPADDNPYRGRRIAKEEEHMCPMCIATAMLIAGSVTSAGGLTAIVIKKFSAKNALDNPPPQPSPSCFEKRT
jgi:hypothetical protein